MPNIDKIRYNNTDYTVDPTLDEVNFKSQVTFSYGVDTSTKCVKKGNMVTINYLGAQEHNFVDGDTLFTIPSGYRPKYTLYIPCVHGKAYAMTYGTIVISTDGTVGIAKRASSSSVAGVTNFYVTYFLE